MHDYHFKPFICLRSFNPHNNSSCVSGSIIPKVTVAEGNQGPEQLGNLPKVTQHSWDLNQLVCVSLSCSYGLKYKWHLIWALLSLWALRPQAPGPPACVPGPAGPLLRCLNVDMTLLYLSELCIAPTMT